MSYVIRLLNLGAEVTEHFGQWVKSYDADWQNGLGRVWSTSKIEDALKFGTIEEATTFYRQTSKVRPIRPWDGKPNRPLTAYTVEFHKADEIPPL